MELDGFTVIAQMVNFIILVLLLKHFLYGPIVRAMQSREQKIRDQLQGAEAKTAEAEQQMQNYAQLQRELEDKRESLLEEAMHEVRAQQTEQMESLRQEIAATRTRWHEEVEYEKNNFLNQARMGIGQQACTVAAKILQDLAGVELEQQVVARFIHHLEELADAERDELQGLLQACKEPTVISSFSLDQGQQQQLQQHLQTIRGKELSLTFNTDTNLLCGIALQLDDHKVAWNMGDYLGRLEHELLSLLSTPLSNNGPEQQGNGK